MLVTGRWAHCITVAYEKSGSNARPIASHNPSGTSATAVNRCIHQCSPAPLAVPMPSTRLKGVTKLNLNFLTLKNGDDAENGGSDNRGNDHGPAGCSNMALVETGARIPRQVPHA